MYIYQNVNNSFFKFASHGKVTEDEIVLHQFNMFVFVHDS